VRHLADLTEVEAERVERGLDRQIELRRGRLRLVLAGQRRLLVRRALVLLPLDELDPVVDEVGVEVLDLLLGELDLLEPGDDLVVGEEPLLDAVLNELLQLFDVRQRDLDGQQRTSAFLAWIDGTTCLERTREPTDLPSPGSST
jgi:hypothetical protein